MIRHIVAFNFKEGLTSAQNVENAQRIKSELEALVNVMNGIVELKVEYSLLASSNKDLVIDSLFESVEALDAYVVHPEHVKCVGFIREVLTGRVCVDFEL